MLSAGLEATPHDLRHTYGSWLLQGGLPIAEIARLLGHTDEEVTRIYARLATFPTDDIFAALAGGLTLGGGQNGGQGGLPTARNALQPATSQKLEIAGREAENPH